MAFVIYTSKETHTQNSRKKKKFVITKFYLLLHLYIGHEESRVKLLKS